MTERVVAHPGPELIVLGYRAAGPRSGNAAYQACCTSTYCRTADRLQLVQHQQTPDRLLNGAHRGSTKCELASETAA